MEALNERLVSRYKSAVVGVCVRLIGAAQLALAHSHVHWRDGTIKYGTRI